MFMLAFIEFMVVGLNDGRVSTGLPVLYVMLLLLPTLALCARRLNSFHAPKAFIFMLLIPFLNLLLLSALFIIPERS